MTAFNLVFAISYAPRLDGWEQFALYCAAFLGIAQLSRSGLVTAFIDLWPSLGAVKAIMAITLVTAGRLLLMTPMLSEWVYSYGAPYCPWFEWWLAPLFASIYDRFHKYALYE